MTPENGEVPTRCENILATYALLMRAQLECKFKPYDEEINNISKECMKEFTEKRVKEIIKFGLSEFDRNVKELGRDDGRFCQSLAAAHPQIIKKDSGQDKTQYPGNENLLKLSTWSASEQIGGSNVNGRPYYFDITYLKISSAADQIEIRDVVVNRGNCKLPAWQVEKLPTKLKFGQSMQIKFSAGDCDPAEVSISTNYGMLSYGFQ
ncbi:hypothetical protein [Denitratimonas sp. CY0512]|uniref:hypothetical protein n=1 Tax=Denitratimonas sp. CY0512 TaxID=3131940 RepID=UPI0030D77556